MTRYVFFVMYNIKKEDIKAIAKIKYIIFFFKVFPP